MHNLLRTINMPFQRLRSDLLFLMSRLRDDRSGNIAVIFAISLIAVPAAASAIDFSRANADRAKMQSALNAITLTMAKEASQAASTAQLNANSLSYFKSVCNRSDAGYVF